MTKLRILVVDDEPFVAAALRRSLMDEHEVTVVNSGQKAWELLQAGTEFDAILCDILMPGMTGLELFERVRAESSKQAAKFLFLVGGGYSKDITAALRAIDNPKIDKPFTPASLQRELMGWITPSTR